MNLNARVRAITVGVDSELHHPEQLAIALDRFYQSATTMFTPIGIEIQTRRLVLPIFSPKNKYDCYQIHSMLNSINPIVNKLNIRWLCLPLTGSTAWPAEMLDGITALIRANRQLFIHFLIAQHHQIKHEFANTAAQTILRVAKLSTNGYDNFRIGVGANIAANTPYFPFSYHEGNSGFSLAIETIGPLINIAKKSKNLSLDIIRNHMIESLLPIIEQIHEHGMALSQKTGLDYKGQDISLAPFPDKERSVAGLIELLGLANCGCAGTVTFTALLTDVLKTVLKISKVKTTGFNGAMFSLLEDNQLARANNSRQLSIEKLMLYSTVCGCGLDMIPLPGDIFQEELTAIMFDIATLSSLLNKPLGIRVLPIPMKTSNEMTDFNHDFLTNTRIMAIPTTEITNNFSSTSLWSYLNTQKEKHSDD